MTTVTCQYSGLEFEAKSSRAKNHPRLADLLSQAHRADRYGEMVEALQAVRKVGGYTTIEEYLALLSQHQATAAARRGELAEKRRAAEAESKRNFAELQQRRRERNAALKAAEVQLVTYVPPPSETNYSGAFMTGSQAACKAACDAFTDAVLEVAACPIRCG